MQLSLCPFVVYFSYFVTVNMLMFMCLFPIIISKPVDGESHDMLYETHATIGQFIFVLFNLLPSVMSTWQL
jgi:hypothetical protein